MKNVLSRFFILLMSFVFVGSIFLGGCGKETGSSCKTDKDCAANQICSNSKCVDKAKEATSGKEKGDVESTKKTEQISSKESTSNDAGPSTDSTPDETTKDSDEDLCPPGCPTCQGKQSSPKLGLGAFCKEPQKGAECSAQKSCDKGELCLKPNKFSKKTYCYQTCKTSKDCKKGLSCLTVDGQKVCSTPEPCDSSKGLRCIQNGINNAGYCYKSCEGDKDCGSGQKCLDGLCGVQNDSLEACNYSQQAFCKKGLVCLVSDTKKTAGICYKPCKSDAECSVLKKLTCRAISAGSKNMYCLPQLKPGPLCMGESCSPASTATNCMEGLVCLNGVCSKTCKKETENKDCDVKSGEKCEFVSFSSPRLCLLPPSVTKAGEECSATKRCDPQKGLQCVQISQTKSVCMKECDIKKNAKDGTNPDCGSNKYVCRQAQSGSAGLCFEKAEAWKGCFGGKACPAKFMCVGFGGDEAYCLHECDPSKNIGEGKKSTNPDCDGGKGRCIGLSSGNKGACLPYREPKIEKGKACGFFGNLKSPDCKDGLRCFGGICMVDCDPCGSKLNANGEWYHPNCTEKGKQKTCTPLVYSDGRPAGGICQIKGDPVLNDGDYCGGSEQAGKDCKEGYHCVRFSSAEGAKAVCSKDCDPTGTGKECDSGRCGSLTNGGGICIPAPKRRVKLGGECLGNIGTDGFHDCLAKDSKGRELVCARPPYPGAKRSCQVLCNPSEGIDDNPTCKKYGLTNHLCLIADNNDPTRGACLEKCHFVDKLRCKTSKCTLGQCRETTFGRKGQCDKQVCKKIGGACNKENTCVVSICS